VRRCYLLAISSKPPTEGQSAIAVPDIERRRAGLGAYPHAWVYVSEFNLDVAERSPYYDPSTVQGRFSIPFLQQVAAALQAAIRARGATSIRRS
jgi:hypothetical protein